MVHNDPIIEDIFIILTQYDFYCMIIWIDFFFCGSRNWKNMNQNNDDDIIDLDMP